MEGNDMLKENLANVEKILNRLVKMPDAAAMK